MTVNLVAQTVERGAVMERIRSCTMCPLRESATQPIVFRGRTPAPILLVGEAPDRFEDKYNRLWIGRMPKWIDEQIRLIGLPPVSEWVVANTVQCATPEGRPPTTLETYACSRHVRGIVGITDPIWVVTMGAVALASTGVKGALNKFHGRPFQMPAGVYAGRWILPTYDPRSTLRNTDHVTDLINDLSTLKKLVTGMVDPYSIACRVGRAGKLTVD